MFAIITRWKLIYKCPKMCFSTGKKVEQVKVISATFHEGQALTLKLNAETILPWVNEASGALCRIEAPDSKSERAHNSTDVIVSGHEYNVTRALILLNHAIGKQIRKNDLETNEAQRKLKMFSEERCWTMFKRAHKGQLPRIKPRKRCIRTVGKLKLYAGHLCVLCHLKRTQKYILKYKDLAMLKDFLCPHTHMVIDPYVTGLCKRQNEHVIRMTWEAQNRGQDDYRKSKRTPGFVKSSTESSMLKSDLDNEQPSGFAVKEGAVESRLGNNQPIEACTPHFPPLASSLDSLTSCIIQPLDSKCSKNGSIDESSNANVIEGWRTAFNLRNSLTPINVYNPSRSTKTKEKYVSRKYNPKTIPVTGYSINFGNHRRYDFYEITQPCRDIFTVPKPKVYQGP
ncbi:28S ribosomal protein S18b, mitochondrial [Thelohanellus kitauei]|uniref:Small ribosomal subunit protein mS40 n=1 Tax=Thelohanellus kitauei TaxID=669202 RepID=A0A0C2MEY9_THEKT|nr:28S ribosomal protein S18b, mitochondrial [Thelohanellus kitauei]